MPQEVSKYYRFCPDKPDALISDAVCLSRRRNNYPWCKGCPFNDDEKAKREAAAAEEKPARNRGRPANHQPPNTQADEQDGK